MNNIYTVTVKRGKEVDNMDITAESKTAASENALNYFYFDGWHVVSAVKKLVI